MLASALHDAQAASGQTPIDSVRFVNTHGKALPGYGLYRVGTDTSGAPLSEPPPLAKGACEAAARSVQARSLTIQTVVTLPYSGGGCAFKFRTPDPASFAPMIVGYKLISALGAPDQRPYLWEVDDQAGVPQFVDGYTPGGAGVSYVKPGSGILFGP